MRTLAHALATQQANTRLGNQLDTVALVAFTPDEQRALATIGAQLAAEVAAGGNGAGSDPRELFSSW